MVLKNLNAQQQFSSGRVSLLTTTKGGRTKETDEMSKKGRGEAVKREQTYRGEKKKKK